MTKMLFADVVRKGTGTDMLAADVSLWLKPSDERRIVMERVTVKRDVLDEHLSENAKHIVSKRTRVAKELFRTELSREGDHATIDVVPVDPDFSWCTNCDSLTDRVAALEKERLQDKESALLRQIALDIERSIKMTIIDGVPGLKAEFFSEGWGWEEDEINSRSLHKLWVEAGRTEGLCLRVLTKYSLTDGNQFRQLLKELQCMKKLFNFTAHPVTQPNGQPVGKAYRASLLGKHVFSNPFMFDLVQSLAQNFLDE